MKKLISFLLILCVLFSGCAGKTKQAPKSSFTKDADEFAICEDMGLYTFFDFAFDSSEFLYDETNGIVEYRVSDSSQNYNYIFRAKKCNEFEDITQDLNIDWESQNNDVQGTYSGVSGNGTIKLNYLDNNSPLPFKGGLWYDDGVKMSFAVIAIGENAPVYTVKEIFHPEYQGDINFDTYQQADEFLQNYGQDNLIFHRQDGDSTSQVQRNDDSSIVVFCGSDSDHIMKNFSPDGGLTLWTKETNGENGNFIETCKVTNDSQNDFTKSEYTKDYACIHMYFENYNTGYVNECKQDPNGMKTYEFWEDEREKCEIRYTQTGGSMSYLSKPDSTAQEVTFKKLTVDGVEKRHYLTIDNEYYSKKFTYVSEDSPILTQYEATDLNTGEHVIWSFNGKGNSFENMTTLVRTYNGVTTTHTYDTVPWGTGILYAPKNPGQFYF